jgi:exopolyphosphatase/guanosine-5'-triphosphate,3'-diphosphate pyrophosphatase
MIRKRLDAPKRKSEIRACCDLGSSYFRLLVVAGLFPEAARLESDRLHCNSFRDERRYAGWGDDVAAGGSVRPETLARAITLLAELVAISREAGCARPAIVGTATLRESANAASVRETLEQKIGAPIRVLSQREEADLGFRGAAFFCRRRERLCLIDIGGMSTELSWGRGIEMEEYTAFPIGTHRAHAILVDREGRVPSGDRIAALLAGNDAEPFAGVADVSGLPLGVEDSTMLVTGGTATTLAMLGRLMRGLAPAFEGVERMTIDDLAAVRQLLAEAFSTGTEASLPFDEGRIRLLPAGSLLVESLLRAFGVREFIVTTKDLRWGVVLGGGGAER